MIGTKLAGGGRDRDALSWAVDGVRWAYKGGKR
jgi:hypothetical protein